MQDRFPGKKEIIYPRKWLYKVIGTDRGSLEAAVAEIVGEGVPIVFSNISRKGNYLAFNVEVVVANQQARDDIYQRLKQHPAVRVVI